MFCAKVKYSCKLSTIIFIQSIEIIPSYLRHTIHLYRVYLIMSDYLIQQHDKTYTVLQASSFIQMGQVSIYNSDVFILGAYINGIYYLGYYA